MLNLKLTSLVAKVIFSASIISSSAMATVVTFDTSEGAIEVNLFDETTPKTVENFLSYVNEQSYDNTVIHRSIAGFIMQGGGFTYEGSLNLSPVTSLPSVINEPVWSNRTGTIAMAKLGNQPNSATNEWFFNLSNNHANLDLQNGGFTVFGQVVNGMDVIEKIESIGTCNIVGTIFSDLPMPNFTCSSSTAPGAENLVTIYSVTISDTSVDSAKDLNPVKNTLIEASNVVDDVIDVDDSDSGGSLGMFALFCLGLTNLLRQRNSKA